MPFLSKINFKIFLGYFRKQSAFTLIELIIVVAILAVLASMVLVAVNPNKRIGNTNDSRRWSDVVSIVKAIEFYVVDYGQLPSDFSTSTVAIDAKVVLCDNSATLSCDGQSRGCLVVNDTDFLGVYLGQLPVDPLKTSTSDTGYYLTRNSNNTISIGVCSAYSANGISTVANVELPAYISTAVCGNGELEYGETCDDGNIATEGCGNAAVETAGTYCNSACTASIVIASSEACDYYGVFRCEGSGDPSAPWADAVGCTLRNPNCFIDCSGCTDICGI